MSKKYGTVVTTFEYFIICNFIVTMKQFLLCFVERPFEVKDWWICRHQIVEARVSLSLSAFSFSISI